MFVSYAVSTSRNPSSPAQEEIERCMQCNANMISNIEEKKTDLAELNGIYKGKAIALVVRLLRQRCSF